MKKYELPKKRHHETRTFFDPPLVKSRGVGFPTRNRREVYLKFFDLEADADRFTRFRQNVPPNREL